MRYVIRHQMRLAFPAAVREHHCELRLAPVDDARQRRRALRLAVEPAARLRPYTDAFGNLVHAFDVLAPHRELVTLLEAEVETTDVDPLAFTPVEPERELAWIAEALHAHPALWDFVLHRSPSTPALEQVPRSIGAPSRDDDEAVVECVQAAMAWVGRTLDHVPGQAPADQPLAQAVQQGAGTSQDFAHLLVAVVRSWGVPARTVAGYLDPSGGAVDDRSSHAWAEVLVPDAGWLGFDAVRGRIADARYVRVAAGRDHGDVAPQRGTFLGAGRGDAAEVRSAIMRQYQQ